MTRFARAFSCPSSRAGSSADTRRPRKSAAELIRAAHRVAIMAPALLRHGFLEASEKLRVIGSSYDLIGLTQGLFGAARQPHTAVMAESGARLNCAMPPMRACGTISSAPRSARPFAAANVAQGMRRTAAARPPRHGAHLSPGGKHPRFCTQLGKQGDVAGIAEAAERLDKAKRKGAPAGLVAIS